MNLLIATGHNNLAMNRSVLQVARRNAAGEGMRNRVEAVIRDFDPGLTCATHELGRMPFDMPSVDADRDELRRIVGG